MKQINLNSLNFKTNFSVIQKKKILIIKNTNFIYYFLLKKTTICQIKFNNVYLKNNTQLIDNIIKIKNILLFGIKKKLILLGLGFQAFTKFNLINFKIGYSHTIFLKILSKQISISIFKCRRKNINITIFGYNYEQINNFANKIKLLKNPNAYKEVGFYVKNCKKKTKLFKKK